MLRRAQEIRPRASASELWPAPSKGWVQSGNIVMAGKDQAEVLDNFIPTAQGARIRGGLTEYADFGAAIVRMMAYRSGNTEDMFAASASKIWDADRVASGSNAFAEWEGQASGDWSSVQISTSGGQFMVAVSGSDHGIYWDGSEFNPITTVAVEDLPFDAESAAFAVGETVTGGTSGATATIAGIIKTSTTAGTLKVTGVTGTFQDNEALTDGATGAATAAGANSAASSVVITGVATSALSQVWLFKERLFFVEKDTMSAWYLPVESIGGAASEIDLGSVFSKGGKLMFGATWSLDSGSGLDDVCIFVSDQGEIAVYEGTDPASASTWALAGVYEIGKPLDKHSWFKAGGDLAVMTEDGIVPVSEALRKDRGALQAVALTYPIEDAWRDAVLNRSGSDSLSVALWQSGTILLVGTSLVTSGNLPIAFVANSRTGAWARITGWDVRCQVVANDQLYVADGNGKMFAADSGGNDDGTAYTCTYVPKFASSDALRSANAANLTYRAPDRLTMTLGALADYQTDNLAIPAAFSYDTGATWGSGVWGTFVWGGNTAQNTYSEWQAGYANGYALAPYLTITANQTAKPVFEVLAMRLRFEAGYAL